MNNLTFTYDEIIDNFDNCLSKLLNYRYYKNLNYNLSFTESTASIFRFNLIKDYDYLISVLNKHFFKNISPIICKRISYLILINDICLQKNEEMLNNLLLKGNEIQMFECIFGEKAYILNKDAISFPFSPFKTSEDIFSTSDNPDNDSFESIALSQIDLYKKKNSDYGSATDKLFQKHGFEYYQIMLEQKMQRIDSLTQKDNKHNFESLEDTLLDLSNYAILAVESLRKQKHQND